MNAANALTLARLLATPFVVALMYREDPLSRYLAAGLFIAAMITDLFDGYLARRAGPTTLGTFLDPIADKTLILSVLIALGAFGIIPFWIGLVLMFREFWVSAIRSLAAVKGTVVGANWMGKSKTFLQVILIVWGLWIHARQAAEGVIANLELTGILVFAVANAFLALTFAVVFTWWHRRLFDRKELGA